MVSVSVRVWCTHTSVLSLLQGVSLAPPRYGRPRDATDRRPDEAAVSRVRPPEDAHQLEVLHRILSDDRLLIDEKEVLIVWECEGCTRCGERCVPEE